MEKASEKDLEKAFTREADRIGGLSLKWVSPGYNGVPDRILLVSGRVYFVELKTEDEWLKKSNRLKFARQRFVHKEMESRGHYVHIIDSWNSLYYFFNHIIHNVNGI